MVGVKMKQEKLIAFCISKIRSEEYWRELKIVEESFWEYGYIIQTFYFDSDSYTNALNPFYMLNAEKYSALLLDAEWIEYPEVIDNLAKKACECHIPFFIWNGEHEAAINFRFMIGQGIADMLEHLTTCHDCKGIYYVSRAYGQDSKDEKFEAYESTMHKMGKAECEIHNFTELQLIEQLQQMGKSDLPDALLCENEDTAYNICYALNQRGIYAPRDIFVCCVGGRSHINHPELSFSAVLYDYDMIAKKVVEYLSPDKISVDCSKNVWDIPCKLLKTVSCGCEDFSAERTMIFLNRMHQNVQENLYHERSIYGLTDKLLKAESVEQIADILAVYMLKNSFFCVNSSFMQDIFSEGNWSGNPEKGEKYFVLTDTRNASYQWKEYLLGENEPGMEDVLADNVSTIYIPVYYREQNFGYLVFCAKDYEREYSKVDRIVRNFGRVLARYVSEKQLTFVNNKLISANESVRKMKHRDMLTGLLNMDGFHYELNNMIQFCKEEQKEIILGCVDIDRLSNINDVYGHFEGDQAIKAVAQIVQQSVSQNTICARLGNDEFVIVAFVDGDSDMVVEDCRESITNQLIEFNRISGKEYTIELNYATLSVIPQDDTDFDALIDEVFTKKNLIKNGKRANKYSSSNTKQEDYSSEEHDLVKNILDQNLFRYAFQPIVNARNGEIYAYEALMRSATDKFISPLTILKYADMEKRLYHIEYATLNNVFKLVKENRDLLKGRKVFVNSIPGYYLEDRDFDKLKHRYKDVFDNVVIEVTEQTEADAGGIDILLGRSDNYGFELAIDDFGTGYSNTVNLLKYLPNYVKIDRLLISNIHEEPKKQHFVKNIIEFAHDNGFMALAEGVETQEELSALIKMDIDLIQGFYTARPQFEIIPGIDEKCKKQIIQSNLERYETLRKKVYIANEEKEIGLVRLALEKYTGIVVSQPELKIIGNSDFQAGVVIRIKENTNCRLTISNVWMKSSDLSPCIDIGENSTLTLVVEEDNHLFEGGIRVPESAHLILEGTGNLMISSGKNHFYGIGNDINNEFGTIECHMSGCIKITANGNTGVGIGGGSHSGSKGILIDAGKVLVDLAAVKGVGIGAMDGNVPIELRECSYGAMIAFSEGIALGSLNGEQKIKIQDVRIDVDGSGIELAGIGTIGSSAGIIDIRNAAVYITLSSRKCCLVGFESGQLHIISDSVKYSMNAEATQCLGFGTYSQEAIADISNITFQGLIRSNGAVLYGLDEELSHMMEITKQITVE